jgi:hypothetical protein
VTSLYERAHDAYRAARRDVAPRALKEKGLELEAGGMACIAACRDCTASATAILLLQRCRVRGETLHTVRCSGRVWPRNRPDHNRLASPRSRAVPSLQRIRLPLDAARLLKSAHTRDMVWGSALAEWRALSGESRI